MDATGPDLAISEGNGPIATEKATVVKSEVDGSVPNESSNPPASADNSSVKVSSGSDSGAASLSKDENDTLVSVIQQKIQSTQDKCQDTSNSRSTHARAAQNGHASSGENSPDREKADFGLAQEEVPAAVNPFNPVSPSSDTDHTLRSGSSASPVHITAEKATYRQTAGIAGDHQAENTKAHGTVEDERLGDCSDSIPKNIEDVKVSSSSTDEVPSNALDYTVTAPGRSDDHDATPETSVEQKQTPVKSTAASSKKKNQKSSLPKPASSSSPSTTSNDSLRRGKWTPEEEAYVTRVIQDFNGGVLNAPAGTTLRSYLSDKLNCDPMRITKKFTGEACIGKRVFHPAVRTSANADLIVKAQAELEELERKWRKRLEIQQEESAKKAAASAAAAAVSGRFGDSHGRLSLTDAQIKRNLVANTASWLDRADAVLSGAMVSPEDEQANPPKVDDIGLLPPSQLQSQMKEVEKLLSEGSVIRKTSKGLPTLLQGAPTVDFARNDDSTKKRSSLGALSVSSEVDRTKRPRRSFSANHLPSIVDSSTATDTADAEGAQALVGLLGNAQSADRPVASPSTQVIRRYSE